MSSNKTANLFMHSWTGSDMVNFNEINENFNILDAKVGSSSSKILNGEVVEAKGFDYNGFNFTSIVPGDFQSQRSKDLLDYGKSTKMDSVAIVCTWFMNTPTSTTISRDSAKTVPDADIIQAIRDAKARGYKVILKPHVDVKDDSWRGSIIPSDMDAWFSSYNTFILTYAQIAQSESVDVFCIGTELKSMTGSDSKKEKWLPVISNIKSVYTGKLTYAATAMNSDDYEEYLLLGFWDQLDYAGLDVYFKLIPSGNTDPTPAEIAAAWSANSEGRDMLKKITDWQKTHGKPVLFTEIGCTVYNGSAQNPGQFTVSNTIDTQEQADYVEAMFIVWLSQSSWLKGILWWRLAFNSSDAFTFENRPSAQVFTDWISHTKGVI